MYLKKTAKNYAADVLKHSIHVWPLGLSGSSFPSNKELWVCYCTLIYLDHVGWALHCLTRMSFLPIMSFPISLIGLQARLWVQCDHFLARFGLVWQSIHCIWQFSRDLFSICTYFGEIFCHWAHIHRCE